MGRIAKWRTFSKQEIKKIVKESYSDREVAEKLGYKKDGGGSKVTLHQMYRELNLDTSHFKGLGWNKDNYDYDSFTIHSYKKRGKTTAAPLIYLRGRKCEKCGNTEWLGEPINLEVHHINGDRTDNRLENLQLLCPNCHSYTPTFTNKGDKRHKTDEEFVEALQSCTSVYQALKHLDLTPNSGNYDRAWKLIYEYDIQHLKKEHQNEKSSE